MVNYAKYKIIREIQTSKGKKCYQLDGYIKYENGYCNDIDFADRSPFNTYQVGDYLEVDLDWAINCIHNRDGYEVNDMKVARKISSSMISTGNAMINASSVNENALATNREMLDRVDRGEKTQFTYQIEDNGVKHSWIYKRN